MVLPLLFLDELPGLRTVHPLVDLDPSAHRRWGPHAIRFHREDYLPSAAPTVQGAVAEAVAAAGGSVRGPVAMLGHVRTWGWLFNPLTLFYCFDPSGREVEWTVLEVSNTPWHERHAYVVGPPGAHTFTKAMHVSPFLPMPATYALRYSPPGESIGVGLDVSAPQPPSPYGRGHEPECSTATPWMSASMALRRRPLNRAGLARLLWSYPLMTTRVSGGIYAQAVRLTLRGAPLHRHPAQGVVASAPSGDDMVYSGHGDSCR